MGGDQISLIHSFFAMSIGALLIVSISIFILDLVNQPTYYHKSLFAMCMAAVFYQFSTLQYIATPDLQESVFWLKVQNTALLTFYPLCFYAIAIVTKQQNFKHWFMMFGIVCGAGIVINWIEPLGIRFEASGSLKQINNIWGESLFIIQAPQSVWGTLLHSIMPLIFVWWGFRCYRLYQANLKHKAVWLFCVLLVLMGSSIFGVMIDAGKIDGFYIAGFSFILFVLFLMFELASFIKQKTELVLVKSEALKDEINKRKMIEQLIKKIASNVSSSNSQDFFNDLVLSVSQSLDVQFTFIGLFENNKKSVETMSVGGGGKIIDNFSFSLSDTPSMKKIAEGATIVVKNARSKFENDWFLKKLSIEGFMGTPMYDQQNQLLGVVVVLDTEPLKDVELLSEMLSLFAVRAGAEIQRVKAENRNKVMAYQDYLTELPNRANLNNYLKNEITTAIEKNRSGALMIIDLDGFKVINEAVGTKVGDDVLRKIGWRLKEQFEKEGFLARVGGDEFILVAENLTHDVEVESTILAQKIIARISQPVQVGERIIQVGCSVGVALYPLHTNSENQIIRYAENALIQAKHSGRGMYKVFDPSIQKRVDERKEIQKELQTAIENDELSMFYQPQIMNDGSIMGAEALIRWNSPKRGLVSPAYFIPIAEECGLIHRLGNWIFETCFTHMKKWQNSGSDFSGHISINVSTWQFSQPGFVLQLIATLNRFAIQPEKVVLELTETGLLQDMEQTFFKLRLLKQKKIQVALDDFGTGYSSLAYLRDLPIDILKIDKAFIDKIEDKHNYGLVESIISISRHMDMGLIAEGVEHEKQARLLEKMGCQCIQGYLYAKPMSERDFYQWFLNYQLPNKSKAVNAPYYPY